MTPSSPLDPRHSHLSMLEFLQEHKDLLGWVFLASLAILILSVLTLPWLVAWIPPDYFASETRPPSRFAHRHPVIRIIVWIVRNLIGVLLILAGIAMLFLPGQGVLTIAAGILLIDFPGKHKVERRIVRNESVWKSINWLRKKAKAAPLVRPDGFSTAPDGSQR